jgi:hypothetical protein
VPTGATRTGSSRKASAAPESVTLSLVAQTVTCVGTPPALDRAVQLIHEALAGIPPARPGGGPAGRDGCGICLCDVEAADASTRLLCGHAFHRECLAAQVVEACRPAGSPLPVCCSRDGCGRPLALRDLLAACPCPTPDCPQVLSRAHPGQWQCDCCLRRYCVPCSEALDRAVDVHDGASCADYRAGLRAAASAAGAEPEEVFRELLERVLREGLVRKCPACALPQGKASGCNHVTCSGCGATAGATGAGPAPSSTRTTAGPSTPGECQRYAYA